MRTKTLHLATDESLSELELYDRSLSAALSAALKAQVIPATDMRFLTEIQMRARNKMNTLRAKQTLSSFSQKS